MKELAGRICSGEVRAIAKGISTIEDQAEGRLELLKALHREKRGALKLGITGPPGAGKSSLVNRLIQYLRKQQLKVAIIAVDPSSPFTGGALLGDRVRMSNHFTDTGVYIRSMGTRGSLGGLARATKESVHLLDAARFDVILIETVGVGQTELEIMHIADTTAVVLTPHGGDTVQAFKAGIMEIADLYVINKADLPGTEKLRTEIQQMIEIVKHDSPWQPPIVKTISTQNEGVADFWSAVQQHRVYQQQSGEADAKEKLRMRAEVTEIMLDFLYHEVRQALQAPIYQHKLEQIHEGKTDPYTIAEDMINAWRKQRGLKDG